MLLDDFKEDKIFKSEPLTIFQKIVLFIEIVILMTFSISFFRAREIFADVFMLTIYGAILLYIFCPILLFRSKTIKGHIFSHIAGLLLFSFFIGLSFKISSWPHAYEILLFSIFPMSALLINLLISHSKDIEKVNFYLRIGLRFIFMMIVLWYFY
jgi:hypothetical protein